MCLVLISVHQPIILHKVNDENDTNNAIYLFLFFYFYFRHSPVIEIKRDNEHSQIILHFLQCLGYSDECSDRCSIWPSEFPIFCVVRLSSIPSRSTLFICCSSFSSPPMVVLDVNASESTVMVHAIFIMLVNSSVLGDAWWPLVVFSENMSK